MSQKAIVHSIIIIFASLVTYIWATDPTLAYYNLQLTAVLLIILIITRYLIKPASFRLVESIISTMAIILVVSDTGGLHSPLFFLNFFLLFELSLLLEPVIPLVLSFVLVFIYITLTADVKTLGDLTILSSFPFMTPLAIFLGKIYRKEENQKQELRKLNNKIKTRKSA